MTTTAQQCRFLSNHRGLKEINFLLDRFTSQAGETIWSDPLYQELMTHDDMWLWQALMNPHDTLPPEHLSSLIERIRSTHVKAQE